MKQWAAPVAAAALLAAAWWYWREQLNLPDQLPDPEDPDTYYTEPDLTDEMSAAIAAARNLVFSSPVKDMQTSPAGLAHLASFEALRLERYELGDGGWTIGRGRFFPHSGPPAPERISLQTADAWFAEDVATKAERWVKAYVTVELQQHQFDALVSMAFNLSPKSFRRIAEAVNAGGDPAPIALQYVRAGTNLERGLRRRRSGELAMFNQGTYA